MLNYISTIHIDSLVQDCGISSALSTGDTTALSHLNNQLIHTNTQVQSYSTH